MTSEFGLEAGQWRGSAPVSKRPKRFCTTQAKAIGIGWGMALKATSSRKVIPHSVGHETSHLTSEHQWCQTHKLYKRSNVLEIPPEMCAHLGRAAIGRRPHQCTCWAEIHNEKRQEKRRYIGTSKNMSGSLASHERSRRLTSWKGN